MVVTGQHGSLAELCASMPLPKVVGPDWAPGFHIRINVLRDIPWLSPKPKRKERLLIVGAGPSLSETLDRIKTRKRLGDKVMAINSAHDWLIDHGVIPDYFFAVDPQRIVKDLIKKPNQHTQYMIGSCCHPDVFDALEDCQVTLVHLGTDTTGKMCKEGFLQKFGKEVILIGGFSTAVLRAPGLGDVLGFRKFDFHGVDSSYTEQTHVDRDQRPPMINRLQIQDAGRSFDTNVEMLRQCNYFFDMYKLLKRHGATVRVYGDGMLPHFYRRFEENGSLGRI